MCAQMAPSFSALLEGSSEDWASLEEHACPDCWRCNGSGSEIVSHDHNPSMNLANENAFLLLNALGLPKEGFGSVNIHEARRAVIRANNVTGHATRETETRAAGRFVSVGSSERRCRGRRKNDFVELAPRRKGSAKNDESVRS